MIIATALIVGLAGWSTPLCAQDALVTASEPRPVIENRIASVELALINRTDLPLSAWKITVTYTLSDGRQGSRSITRDVFGVLAGIQTTGPVAPANTRVRDVIPIGTPPGIVVETATVTLECAVFADGSWTGSERQVNEIFEARAAEREAWEVIASAMRAGGQLSGRPGLERALAVLNQQDQKNFNNTAKQMMRRNIERAIAGELKADADTFLKTWTQRSDQRIGALTEHGRRRNERTTR